MDEFDPVARIVWKLARNHTWGRPMPENTELQAYVVEATLSRLPPEWPAVDPESESTKTE
jgi:hypothetical protein